MRIFGRSRKKKKDTADLLLTKIAKETRYDIWSALAKAVLVFALVYGALGGFLSAYDIEYNRILCMTGLFFAAFFLAAVYETGKIWAENLANILIFALYLYAAVRNFWVINNGYYSILNHIYETARNYLGVADGIGYSLIVEDEYAAVTGFSLFIGLVGVISFNIFLHRRASLLRTVLFTLPMYALPFYFEGSPDLMYIILLLTGYVTAAVLQGSGVKEHIAGQIRYVLPAAAVIVAVLVRLVAFALPQRRYDAVIPPNASKKATEGAMAQFAQVGLMALFQNGSFGAGMSSGSLSKRAMVMPNYQTDLVVRFTPYSYGPVYLKNFTGKDYDGSRWSRAEDGGAQDGLMAENVAAGAQNYENDSSRQGRGVMEVEIVDPAYMEEEQEYRPYYTDVSASADIGAFAAKTYIYYPPASREEDADGADAPHKSGITSERTQDMPSDNVSPSYRIVPKRCRNAVQKVCEDAGFSGSAQEIADQITEYFRENYSYTMRPGFYYGNPDYITHFLLESRRGYCAHFASAGTMLFRYMGIPARYVEGYAFTYNDVVVDGVLVENAAYEDYYDGYSPIGRTGLIELEVSDARAHAWIEIYVDTKGWIVVDPTPSAREEEDMSFWEAFLNGNDKDGDPDAGGNNIGEYIENAIGGIVNVLFAAAFLFLCVPLFRYVRCRNKEKKLSGRERACLEYRRLAAYLSRKDKGFAVLPTLRQQLQWLERRGTAVSEDEKKALYEIFFAKETAADCGELQRKLAKVRRRLKLRRF